MEEQEKKSLINEIKVELEDLEKHLKKSSDEFKTTYQEKKKKFAALIKDYVNELEESGGEKVQDAKESSMELIDLLEADYDISYTEYEDEPHKLAKAIDTFEEKAKEVFDTVSASTSKAKENFDKEFAKNKEKFNTELDIQKAHFQGTKDRTMKEYEDWKEKRLEDIEQLKGKLDQQKEEAGEKFGKFSEEMTESLSHLKKAFKNLW